MVKKIRLCFLIKIMSNKTGKYKYVKKAIFVDIKSSLRDILTKIYFDYSEEKRAGAAENVFLINKDLFTNNYSFNDLRLTNDLFDYLDNSIIDLDNQFRISRKVIKIWLDAPVGGGPVHNGVKYFFHMDEKDLHKGRPHIHCKYSGDEIRVALKTEEFIVLNGRLKSKSKMREIKRIIMKNNQKLSQYWDDVIIGGKSIKFDKNFIDFS